MGKKKIDQPLPWQVRIAQAQVERQRLTDAWNRANQPVRTTDANLSVGTDTTGINPWHNQPQPDPRSRELHALQRIYQEMVSLRGQMERLVTFLERMATMPACPWGVKEETEK